MKPGTSARGRTNPIEPTSSRYPIEASAAEEARPRDRKCYRANCPIMVLAFQDNHHAAVTLPPGEMFEVFGPAHDDDRFVVVRIRDQEFLVFEVDIRARAELVKNA